MANVLDSWTQGSFTADGRSYPTYRRGSGPGVVVIHEIPNITPRVAQFADDVVESGFTVVMPSLLGRPGRAMSRPVALAQIARVCVSKEFANLALNTTSPIAGWLRALARELHEELGGPGVGAVGMCFSGGFALAMMVEEHTVAPVLSQPSMPFTLRGKAYGADLNLSPADIEAVRTRAADGCPVMGLRYADDPMVGTRFDTLRGLLGDKFIAVEFPGRKHSVLTEHRQETAVTEVLAFLHERLDTSVG